MMASESVATVLVRAGLGVIGGNIFLERLPETPINAIGIVTYAGGTPEYTHDSRGVAYIRPFVQVAVRDESVARCLEIAYKAFLEVSKVRNEGDVLEMSPQQSPFRLGTDANDRPRYVFNVALQERVR